MCEGVGPSPESVFVGHIEKTEDCKVALWSNAGSSPVMVVSRTECVIKFQVFSLKSYNEFSDLESLL
jgi:hypothetical protein